MNVKLKLSAYVILALLALWFAFGFYSNWTAVNKESDAATNEIPVAVTTNAATNVVDQSTNAAPSNTVAVTTNEAPAPTNPPVAVAPAPAPPPSLSPRRAQQGAMIGYLAALVGAAIGLGLLVAYDVTQYLGSRTVDLLFNDKGEGMRDPEYEKAEQVWANGKHLDAIQMMRDYLKKNPREQYVALRIAEIYEKDLHNNLAAILEYEEVLKHKLSAERWGWAAIHLCNLYSKMNQQDKTVALLQRIVDEYPQTGAAKKARSRLGLPEPEEPAAAAPPPAAPAEEPAELPEAPPEPSKSNLPPGFRPKKG